MNDQGAGGPANERSEPGAQGSGPGRASWSSWARLGAFLASLVLVVWALTGGRESALPVLAAAVVLMAAAFWRLPEQAAATPRPAELARGMLQRLQPRGAAVAGGLACAVVSAWMVWAQRPEHALAFALWLAGIALATVGAAWPRVAAEDRGETDEPASAPVPGSGRVSRALALEALIVLAVTGIAWAERWVSLATVPLVMHGDEGEFGTASLAILQGTSSPSPFATGWFGHPTLFNYLQAAAMSVFGTDVDGLRMLSALAGTASVVAVYALMRLYAGRAAAVTAAVLMGVSHLYVHFSRMALNNIESALFVVLVVLTLALARQRRSTGWYTMAGLACGLSLYFYYGSRIIPFVALALLAYAWREGRLSRADALGFALAFIVVVLPLAGHYAAHPPDFGGRVQGVFLFTEQNWRHTAGSGAASWLEVIGRQLQRNLMFFVRDGDGSSFYLRDLPAFDPVTVVLFWAGMAVALARANRFEEYSLLAWFWSTVLVGGVLTNDSPNAPRLILAVPAVFAFAGLFVARLRGFLAGFTGAWAAPLVAVLIVAASALSAGLNYDLYFVQFAAKAGGTATAVMAREMREWEDGYTTYLLGPPHLFVGHGTLRFIAGKAERIDAFGPQDYIPLKNPARGALFIVQPHRVGELERIRSTYPGGVERETRDGLNRLLYISYRVPR